MLSYPIRKRNSGDLNLRANIFFVCVNVCVCVWESRTAMHSQQDVSSSSVHKRKNTGDHKSAFRQHDDMTG